VSTFTAHNEPATEVVYFQLMGADEDLRDAAKRLSIPLWGRLLLYALALRSCPSARSGGRYCMVWLEPL
jgi:hypothetical protein